MRVYPGVTLRVLARLNLEQTRGREGGGMEAVYVQTNDAQKNEVVAYRRESDGSSSKIGSFETGGSASRGRR